MKRNLDDGLSLFILLEEGVTHIHDIEYKERVKFYWMLKDVKEYRKKL